MALCVMLCSCAWLHAQASLLHQCPFLGAVNIQIIFCADNKMWPISEEVGTACRGHASLQAAASRSTK